MLFSCNHARPGHCDGTSVHDQAHAHSAADLEDASKTKASIRQVVYRAHHLDKDEMIAAFVRYWPRPHRHLHQDSSVTLPAWRRSW